MLAPLDSNPGALELVSEAMQYLSTYGGLIKRHHAPCLT